MIRQIYALFLVFLAGFLVYSAINHIATERRMPQNRAHVLFAGMCLTLVIALLFRFLSFRETDVGPFLFSFRLYLAASMLFLALWPCLSHRPP